jgi:hypothetical protein
LYQLNKGGVYANILASCGGGCHGNSGVGLAIREFSGFCREAKFHKYAEAFSIRIPPRSEGTVRIDLERKQSLHS